MEFKVAQEEKGKSIKELLGLAEKKKLDIEELQISEITGQYLDYIKDRKVDTEEVTEFLVAAVKLLSLKVKTLMPSPEPDLWEEEEEQIAEQLARHMMEYKTFKEAAELFKERFESEPKTYVRNSDFSSYVSSVSSSSSLEGLGLGDLLNALEKVMYRDNTGNTVPSFDIPRQEFKVADKIDEVFSLVAGRGLSGVEFERLFSQGAQKGEIIATFLALLELVRLRRIRITQKTALGTILIYDTAAQSSS